MQRDGAITKAWNVWALLFYCCRRDLDVRSGLRNAAAGLPWGDP